MDKLKINFGDKHIILPNLDKFMDLYKKVLSTCQKEGKNLIIVGGTSFYLKSLKD